MPLKLLIFFLILSMLFISGTYQALSDDAVSRASLSIFKFFIDTCSALGHSLHQKLWLVPVTCGIAGTLILAFAMQKHRRFLLVLSALCFAMPLFITGHVLLAWVVCGLAFVLALTFRTELSGALADSVKNAQPIMRSDLAAGIAIIFVATLLRLYALNQVPSTIDGELSAFWLGATNARGMFLANEGVNGPWAPLGLLYYLPMYLLQLAIGNSLLTIRLSSVLVSVVTIGILFIVTRHYFGRVAAVFTLLFASLDSLQIGWARTDVHPHGATSWVGLLIFAVTLHAVKKGTSAAYALMSGLMVLAWHQYPSGQVAVVFPIAIGITSIVLCRSSVARPCRFVSFALLGIVGWLASSVLLREVFFPSDSLGGYLSRLGPRVGVEAPGEDTLLPLLKHVAVQCGIVLQGLTSGATKLFHQDILIAMPELPTRTAAWIIVALALFSLLTALSTMRYLPLVAVVTCGIIATIPGVFSEYAYPKRYSMFFPFLFILAGVGASLLYGSLKKASRIIYVTLCVAGFGGWLCISCYQWFSGTHKSFAPNQDTLTLNEVAKRIVPGTLVVLRMNHQWSPGVGGYLLADTLRRNSPAVIFSATESIEDWRRFVTNPISAYQDSVANSDGVYSPNYLSEWLGLMPRDPSISWRRVLYVFSAAWEDPKNQATQTIIEDAGFTPQAIGSGSEKDPHFTRIMMVERGLSESQRNE